MATSTEIATVRAFNDAELRSIQTFAEVEALFAEKGIQPIEVGNGFEMIEKKDSLIGVPFIILDARFSDGDYGTFVICEIITKDNFKGVIIDGSMGIREQVRALIEERTAAGVEHAASGIVVKRGLTKSDYYRNVNSGDIEKNLPDGARSADWEKGSTFYLS